VGAPVLSAEVKRKAALLADEGVMMTSSGSDGGLRLADPAQIASSDIFHVETSDPLLMTGRDVRQLCRSGTLTGQTSGYAPGFAQANLVIVPNSVAPAFKAYCDANPKPCPLLVQYTV
jgi:hypothetical protein